MKDNWLIEYSEGEVDPRMKKQMQAHLDANSSEKKALNQYQNTKQKLQTYQQALPDLDEAFFDSLHDKIMSAIDDKELPKRPPRSRLLWAPRLPKSWFLASSTLALAAVIFIGVGLLRNQLNSKNIMHHAMGSPDELAEMASYQNSNDFFVDVAGQNFHDLTTKDLKDLIRSN